MKSKLPSLVCVLALAVASAFGQQPATGSQSSGGGGGGGGAGGSGGLPPPAQNVTSQPVQPPPLTRFNLDFPGGTPAELGQAIAKASGKPLNLVVAPQKSDLKLPALRLANVTTPELFQALSQVGSKSVINQQGNSWPINPFDFQTNGRSSDNSVWYLSGARDQAEEIPESIFYNLSPYLDTYTVDDITTALKTAWDLMGETPPKLTFHKETKLLIVVGTQAQHQLIRNELDALKVSIYAKKAAADKAEPKPAEAAKP